MKGIVLKPIFITTLIMVLAAMMLEYLLSLTVAHPFSDVYQAFGHWVTVMVSYQIAKSITYFISEERIRDGLVGWKDYVTKIAVALAVSLVLSRVFSCEDKRDYYFGYLLMLFFIPAAFGVFTGLGESNYQKTKLLERVSACRKLGFLRKYNCDNCIAHNLCNVPSRQATP